MLDAIREHWGDLSTNFLNNYYKIKFFLYTVQYVKATGDTQLLEDMYLPKSDI